MIPLWKRVVQWVSGTICFLRSDLDAEELERVEAGEPREKYQHLVESVLSTG